MKVKVLLTAADAARVLGVTPSAVRQMEGRGAIRLAARTEGGVRLFRRLDVERLAKKRSRVTQAQEKNHVSRKSE